MVEQASPISAGWTSWRTMRARPARRTAISQQDFDRITEELWDDVLQVNLIGVFRCTKAAAPALKAARGAVVNTASIAGLNSPGSSMAYGATKAGVISLTKNLARGAGAGGAGERRRAGRGGQPPG